MAMETDKEETKKKQAKLGCLMPRLCNYSHGPYCTYPGIIKIDDDGKCKMKQPKQGG